MAVETYRVEKDGVTFYVQKESMKRYEDDGYVIFNHLDQRVDANGNVLENNKEEGVQNDG